MLPSSNSIRFRSFPIYFLLSLITYSTFIGCIAQKRIIAKPTAYSRADSLRGSINENRRWWNVLRYDLEITPNYEKHTIIGRQTIRFAGNTGRTMQIDLQQPLVIDSILFSLQKLPFKRDGNIALVAFKGKSAKQLSSTNENQLTIYYRGKPRVALRPPWDGGWIWKIDAQKRPWMTVSCQGLGASSWYPCKDHQSEEPDLGASITIWVADPLVAVANGQLVHKFSNNGLSGYKWEVKSPINSYNLVPYIGYYEGFGEIFDGEEGELDCRYWVLDYNLAKAKEQFKQVKPMLRCFEYWFGPYPFYEDGYQLIESPHLGMEHQSGIAYGNHFINGYRGKDLSGSGWGNQWDFIIIHESGHEWFGNNITSADVADMWVHESFTNYSESLFTECQSGKIAGAEYARGLRKIILNDRPIIGEYGVQKEGSRDMYYKGSNMLHTIRTIVNNDSLFRQVLRGLNKTFYHCIVTGKQVENYLSTQTGIDFTKIFEQYLTTTQVPIVEWKIKQGVLSARLTHCVKDLSMKMWFPTSQKTGQWLIISDQAWTQTKTTLDEVEVDFLWNKNYYVEYKAVLP